MSSDPDEFLDSAERLLADCLGLPRAEQRAELDRLCAARAEWAEALRQRFERLCAAGLAGEQGAGPGRVGDFVLGDVIGTGGMGVVYRARQLGLGRDVAVKLLRPEQAHLSQARARFRREAEAIARLDHPGIVPILAFGDEGSVAWLAMPLLEGRSLADGLRHAARRASPPDRGADLLGADAESAGAESFAAKSYTDAVVVLAVQVAQALEHAHQRGVRHRDVKPSNIWITRDGRALLLDFGLAAAEEQDGLTQTGSPLGTLWYMPPEQLRGERSPGGTGDVYGLGATLHECLSLVPPFAGETRREIEDRILSGQRQPLRRGGSSVHRELDHVVARAMEVDPRRRYATAAAFAADLMRYLERRPVLARAPSRLNRAVRWLARHPAQGAAGLLAFGLFVVAPTLLLLREAQLGTKIAQALARERTRGEELAAALAREQEALVAARESLVAEQAARAAEQAAWEENRLALGFFVEVLDQANPERARGEDVRLVDVLERMARKLRSFQGPPRVAARLLSTVAQTQSALDRHDEAVGNAERALELERQAGESLGLFPGALEQSLGMALVHAGRPDTAEEHLRRALLLQGEPQGEASGQAGEENTPSVAGANLKAQLGLALLRQGRFAEAEAQLSAAFEAHEAMQFQDPLGWGTAGVHLAECMRAQAKLKPTRDGVLRWGRHVRHLAQTRLSVLEPDTPLQFQIAQAGAHLFAAMGRFQDALELAQEAREGAIRVFGPTSSWTLVYSAEQAALLRASGKAEAGEQLLDELLATLSAQRGPAHPDTLWVGERLRAHRAP